MGKQAFCRCIFGGWAGARNPSLVKFFGTFSIVLLPELPKRGGQQINLLSLYQISLQIFLSKVIPKKEEVN